MYNTKEKHNTYHRKYRKTQRDAVFAFLGTKCKRCGFDDIRALQIDHVNGGGSKEWDHGTLGYSVRYKMVYANPANYQILCANCNWIKRAENNELPYAVK